jgi:hypothetical protein
VERGYVPLFYNMQCELYKENNQQPQKYILKESVSKCNNMRIEIETEISNRFQNYDAELDIANLDSYYFKLTRKDKEFLELFE